MHESMSIARDCYDKFVGIVIIEIAKDWSEQGLNHNFECLPAYICDHQGVCFIILVKGNNDNKTVYDIRKSLNGCAVWVTLGPEQTNHLYCVNLFHSMARDLGYEVSIEASTLLPQALAEVNVSDGDLRRIVCRTLLQIDLEKKIKRSKMIIDASDLDYLPKEEYAEKRNRIGFSIDK